MLRKLFQKTQRPLSAELYDITLCRPVKTDDFHPALAFGDRIFYRSDNFGLVIPLIVRELSPREYQVRIDAGTIVEEKAIRYRLMKTALFPDLLETKTGDDGAFLLSIGAGVLADFRPRPRTVLSDRIYMEQRQWEKMSMMNCFGRIHESGSVLAVVEEGDFNCRIVSEYGDEGKNRIYASFDMRGSESDMLKCESKSIRFICAGAAPAAGYPELAFLYREYLLKNGMDTLKTRMKNNEVLQYSADALRVKIFLACKTPAVSDGSSPVHVCTTFDEACTILDAMKDSGIRKAVITLVGWNLGGHDGAYPTHFPVEPSLGGEEGLRRLIAKAEKLNYQIVPHDNVTDVYRGSPDFDYKYVAQTEGGEPLAAGIWSGGQSYKACPRVYLERYGSELEKIRNLGFRGHYYMDAQSTVLWSCHDKRHPADEREFALTLSSLTTAARVRYGAVSTEGAAAYILPYIDEASSLHNSVTRPAMLKTIPDEALQSLSVRSVPFYHIALHGLLLYQNQWIHTYPDPERGKLFELVLGARPCMEISFRTGKGNGGDWKKCLELMHEPYRICFEELRVQCEQIRSFREPENGYYEIEYESGTSIRVNTTDRTVSGLAPASWERIS